MRRASGPAGSPGAGRRMGSGRAWPTSREAAMTHRSTTNGKPAMTEERATQDEEHGAIPAGPRVVVGVDGSEAARAALVYAAEEARLRGALLEVVHAWQYPFDMAATTYSVPVPAGEMKQWAEQVVDDMLSDAEVDPARVARVAVNGPAAPVLMEAAKGADLLVVGTRGHNRMTGLFLGSVSQYLAVHAPCPVLVVHGPPAHRAPPPQPAPATAGEEPRHAGPVELSAGSIDEIPEEECLALLGAKHVGRLVVVHE